ncbi:hypothetical protein GBA52_010863 [Prunus armeniaca]|nr:hypothetical protein GBA52_010863 [Prunus armeniaca]
MHVRLHVPKCYVVRTRLPCAGHETKRFTPPTKLASKHHRVPISTSLSHMPKKLGALQSI